MFIALITYNCSLTTEPKLQSYNQTRPNCSVTISSNRSTETTVHVICYGIENFAGRNWAFRLIENSSDEIIQNETFIVTLAPLSLSGISINGSVDEDFTGNFSVPDCEKIADLQYLVFRCNSTDESNRTLSDCTFQCFRLEPGSDTNVSLVRLPIPKFGKDDSSRTFPEEISNETTFRIG